jgi:hypothetical protein
MDSIYSIFGWTIVTHIRLNHPLKKILEKFQKVSKNIFLIIFKIIFDSVFKDESDDFNDTIMRH